MGYDTQHRHIAIVVLQGTKQLKIIAHILLDGGNNAGRVIVGTEVDHHQIGLIRLEVIGNGVVVVEQTVMTRQQVFLGLLLLGVVAD